MEGFPPKPPSSDLEVRSKPLGLEDEMGQIVFGYLLHIEKWIFLVDVPMNKGDFSIVMLNYQRVGRVCLPFRVFFSHSTCEFLTERVLRDPQR